MNNPALLNIENEIKKYRHKIDMSRDPVSRQLNIEKLRELKERRAELTQKKIEITEVKSDIVANHKQVSSSLRSNRVFL